MPCYDSRDSSHSMADEYRDRANLNARIACAALRELEDNGIVEALLLRNNEVRAWWEEHKEFDRKEGRR